MKILGYELRRAERRDSIENPAVSLSSADAWASVFTPWGGTSAAGASVTPESALGVPAVLSAVSFLSRTMAALPLHAYRSTSGGPERIKGSINTLVQDAPNEEWTSFDWREYLFWQVFTVGRGLAWIERAGSNIVAIWPMETGCTEISFDGARRSYRYTDQTGTRLFPSRDIIDIPFALKPDRLTPFSPIDKCRNAIGLALAMESYASGFFRGGGIPPLALTGPLPSDPAAMRRAMGDVWRSVEAAKEAKRPIFPMPPGHDLKPVGAEPEKSQMAEGRLMQIQEIARAFQLPPIFLQDMSKGTFSNTEQQDLFFVKHLIGQWAKRFEQQLNLKLFGQKNTSRYVEHNLDGLLRGDFVTRMAALAQGVQNAILEPNEARALENRPARPHADQLFMQGATVPLGTQPMIGQNDNGGANDPGNADA